MNTFLTSSKAKYKILRTLAQGLVSGLITIVPQLFGIFSLPPEVTAVLQPIIMSVLSKVMDTLGRYTTETVEEV